MGMDSNELKRFRARLNAYDFLRGLPREAVEALAIAAATLEDERRADPEPRPPRRPPRGGRAR
jgi:hypothetical protein